MDATSSWTVTEESSLNGLVLEKGAVINGIVLVKGQEVDTTSGGSWTGTITVSPLSGTETSSGEASSDSPTMEDGSLPPDPPADLAPGEEPPGGFGGID